MTAEYWKKRAQELEQQHFKPAHEVQGKPIPNSPSLPVRQQNADNGWKEIDLTQRMQGMIPNSVEGLKALMYAKQAQQDTSQPLQASQNSNRPTVYLKEGKTSYRILNGINQNIDVVKNVGPITGMVGKEFQLIGAQKFYVMDVQETRVDFGNLNPNKIKTLYVVEAPWVGKIVVDEQSIMRKTGSGQTVLKG